MKKKIMALITSSKTWAWFFAGLAADGHILGDNVTAVIVAMGKALGLMTVGS